MLQALIDVAFRRASRAGMVLAVAASLGALSLSSTQASAAETVSLELNKLEQIDKVCRAYLVINNNGKDVYQTFNVEVIIFQPDGLIGKHFLFDLAPIKKVKMFDLKDMSCDGVGTMHINGVTDCKTEAGSPNDCLARLELSSHGQVKVSK